MSKTTTRRPFYNTGFVSTYMDTYDGKLEFEHGQVVLVKDHINWQWEQRAFHGFGQNGILTTYATANKAEGNVVGWAHFYKGDPSTARRLAHLPKVGEIVYRRHIYPEYWDEQKRREECIKYKQYDCTVKILEDPLQSTDSIREYMIIECEECPELVGTTASCIMEFHENGARKPTGWNVHFCTEV